MNRYFFTVNQPASLTPTYHSAPPPPPNPPVSISSVTARAPASEKIIALMEMSKLIPGLIPQFELQLEHPEKESRVYNDCFYEAKGVEV